jgi:hypothetical protein
MVLPYTALSKNKLVAVSTAKSRRKGTAFFLFTKYFLKKNQTFFKKVKINTKKACNSQSHVF